MGHRRTDSRLHASAVTLAEVTDGSARDARVRRIAKAIRIEEVTELIGYRAGGLRTKAAGARRIRRDLTVDAIVAATALSFERPVGVLTSDPRDLELLLSETSVIVESIA